MRKAFKYRLYPNKEQEAKLIWTLDRCCELYNAALQERRDRYTIAIKQHPNYYDAEWRKQATREHAISLYSQQGQVPDIREVRPEYNDIPVVVMRDPLKRVDLAFKRFFSDVKVGRIPGFPRFKSQKRYDSFTYPQTGFFSLTHDNYVRLSMIGSIKVKLHRPVEGKMKTCTVKREGAQWYVIFSCEIEQPEPLPVSYEDVGIDLGVSKLATLSNGEVIEHPRFLRKAQKKLAKLQQSVSRKKRGSHRREKAKKLVGKAYRKVTRQRHDFLHKESRKIVGRYQVIVFEDLQAAHLTKRPKPKQDEETGQYLPNNASAKAGLNKSILDAGWSQFVGYCIYKAEETGRSVVQVNPRYTSQMCSGCGSTVKKDLSVRWHSCPCGTELDRDHNAALNILALGWRDSGISLRSLV